MKRPDLRSLLCAIVVAGMVVDAFGAGFVHPGISHNSAELEFVRAKLRAKEQPWQQAWDELRASSNAELSWEPQPVDHVERGAYNRPDIGGTKFLRDGAAAYTHALMWCFTQDDAHAVKAAEILNAWSSTLESIGNHDAKLLVGMGGINYCNAAELLRHTWTGWPEEEQDASRSMLRRVLYPVIRGFYPTANGNWDASMIQTMMAMGVFLDDTAMFREAVDYFLAGEGNGAVHHYFKPSGQCQESGRDQAHTQMGLEYLVNACEIAWKQGIDLYGAHDSRLAKGFEYTARYNLGEDVPFEYYESYRGRYKHHQISSKSRGRLRDMYERAYNHYHNRRSMDMPWCRKAIQQTRPERGGGSSLPWSTLMYAHQPSDLVPLPAFPAMDDTEAPTLDRPRTTDTIQGEKFLINGAPTYKGRRWNGISVEGLLMNSHMVQGIFDDLNPETAGRWAYEDTQEWDADRNTDEFVGAMDAWYAHGLLVLPKW